MVIYAVMGGSRIWDLYVGGEIACFKVSIWLCFESSLVYCTLSAFSEVGKWDMGEYIKYMINSSC